MMTISEAFEAIREADEDELQQEIAILEEEICGYQRKIIKNRSLIRQVGRLLQKQPAKNGEGKTLAPSQQPATDAGTLQPLWEKLVRYLEFAGPTCVETMAKEFGKSPQSIIVALGKRRGREVRQLDDKRWACGGGNNDEE